MQTSCAGLGFEASVRPTAGHPMVVASAKAAAESAPHVLFYGHYDVQPPDPLDLWESPPFEPRLVDAPTGKQIVGRGTSDDKGQLMTFIEACRAFRDSGGLPCNITILLEGEEETGSPSLPAFLAENRAELKADLALVCDTSMWDRTTPAITTMLRGLVLEEVVDQRRRPRPSFRHVRRRGRQSDPCADADHRRSARCRTAASHFPASTTASPNCRRRSPSNGASCPSTAGNFSNEVGPFDAGRRKRPQRARNDLVAADLRREWDHRRLYRQGFEDRAAGAGERQILLPPGRNAGSGKDRRELPQFRRTRGCRPIAAPNSSRMAPRAHCNCRSTRRRCQRARKALREEWGKDAVLAGCGGSIPIVGAFKRDLGMDTLMIGFGLDDDRIHSPNEKYELSSFHKGARSWARILAALAG